MSSINRIFTPEILKFALPAAGLAIISRTFRYFNFVYYILPLLLLYFALYGIKELKSEKKFRFLIILNSIFFIWILLTCIWSIYPILSLKRSLYYLLLSTGTLSAGYLWIKFYKGSTLNFMLPADLFLILLSIFSLITIIPSDTWTGGNGKGFMGFSGHQNTLAASILFTIPVLFIPLIGRIRRSLKWGKNPSTINHQDKSKCVADQKEDKLSLRTSLRVKSALPVKDEVSPKKGGQSFAFNLNMKSLHFFRDDKITFWSAPYPLLFLIVLNLIFLILSYSRASMLSLLIAFFTYITITLNKKLLVISAIVITSLALGFFVSVTFRNWSDKLFLKQFSTSFESRNILWIPSYHAALQGGITGLGFGVSDPSMILPPGTGSYFQNGIYYREKGNGILALVEETGVIGLVLFLIPTGYVIKKLTAALHGCMDEWLHGKSKINLTIEQLNNSKIEFKHFAFFLSFIIAFFIHAQFEAWFVGIGSVELPLYFLFIGAALAITSYQEPVGIDDHLR